MPHAQTYQMKWPDQLSMFKEKAQHNNVSQHKKAGQKENHAVSKSIQNQQDRNEMFSVCTKNIKI